MIAYFDNAQGENAQYLHHVENIVYQPNPNLLQRLEDNGFTLNFSKKYDKLGIYWLGSLGHPINWSVPRHVLYLLSDDVIIAARQKKLIICLDSKTEGKPFIQNGVDCFSLLHDAMNNLSLPAFSVFIVDGNEHWQNNYTEWCYEHRATQIVTHCSFFDHTWYFPNPPIKMLAIYNAIEKYHENVEVKCFNSLNRNPRLHRLDHLYWILHKGLHKEGIVSGFLQKRLGYKKHKDNDYNTPIVPYNKLRKRCKILNNRLPLIIDGDWTINCPESDNNCIFPMQIYTSSFITVTTETCFHENSMFLTEKTFRPIAAGHPFMILGQYEILKNLQQKGYITDFYGIDQSYDNIANSCERFNAFHKSLQDWCNLPLLDKVNFVKLSIPAIQHNYDLFISTDFENNSYSKFTNKIMTQYKDYG